MKEYIESICRSCFHSYVCEQFNEHRNSYNEKCHFFNDHFVSAADVVEVKRGRWIHYIDPDPEWGALEFEKCSLCGTLHYDAYNFCPNCGADMRQN